MNAHPGLFPGLPGLFLQKQALAHAQVMQLTQDGRSAYKLFNAVRQQKPLIQCITNFVSMVRPCMPTRCCPFQRTTLQQVCAGAGSHGNHFVGRRCQSCDGKLPAEDTLNLSIDTSTPAAPNIACPAEACSLRKLRLRKTAGSLL